MTSQQPQGQRSGEGTAGLWDLINQDQKRRNPAPLLPQDGTRSRDGAPAPDLDQDSGRPVPPGCAPPFRGRRRWD